MGPAYLEYEFTAALEVVFVFNRPLSEYEIWTSQVLRELAASAVEVRAYYQQGENWVDIKVR